MAYSTINKSSSFMNTITYTANASDNAITGVGHQPDFLITKSRTSAFNPNVYNSISGVGKFFNGITTGVEGSSTSKIASFDTDGFTLKNGDNSNYTNNGSGVGWSWKANGTGSANTDGSINSTVSANTTSGFSIVKWSGSGSNATVGHGLGVAPKVILVKDLNASNNWTCYFSALGNFARIWLNLTTASQGTSGAPENNWQQTDPTSTVFSLAGNGETNGGSSEFIAYCFADVQGYSKSGSYIGNGNADGTFVYTGFKPKFVLIKQAIGNNATNWSITDDKRLGYNPDNRILYTNSNATEDSYDPIEHLSNGFKLISPTAGYNDGGDTYIYLAFGQSIVGTNNVPNNAR